MITLRCFACGKVIKDQDTPNNADTRDDQLVQVGPECLKRIRAAGDAGYQPPKGGPRLFLISENSQQDKS